MRTYPWLAYLAGAYFHQDYELDAPTPGAIIGKFLDGEEPGAISDLAAEVKSILDSDMTDGQIDDLWIMTLRASYEPARDGLTYRGWLATVLDTLVH